MRTFRYRNTVPPSRYPYFIPELREEVLGGDLMQTINKARLLYARNGLIPPANLAALVEHYVCLQNPASFCNGTYEPGDEQATQISAIKVKETSKFGGLRLKWPKEKFLAPLPLAESRAETCVACRHNHLGFCTVCHGLATLAAETIGDRRTTVDAKLGVCAICSCLSKLKIHVSAEALKLQRRSPDDGVYPDTCWLVKEGIIPHEE